LFYVSLANNAESHMPLSPKTIVEMSPQDPWLQPENCCSVLSSPHCDEGWYHIWYVSSHLFLRDRGNPSMMEYIRDGVAVLIANIFC